ncbi:hypothetical protein [Methylorubrum populi]
MGRVSSPTERPSYEQLKQIIAHKDEAVRHAYWNSTTIKSLAWLAYQAHDSGSDDYNAEKYGEAAMWTLKLIAEHAHLSHEELEAAHAGAHNSVLNQADATTGQS